VNLRAVRRRGAPDTLLRMTELAVLLTGSVDAEPEDVALWLAELATTLEIAGLADHGLSSADTTEVVAATQRASSMRGNPIELTDDEVAEILTGSL
jgi:alcohol dehydrogenase class IV